MGVDMELESNPLLERSVFQRLLFAMMVIALVLAFLAGVTWFIRSFILPPRVAIPSRVSVAAAPPAPSMEVVPPAVPSSTSAETSSEPSAQPSTAQPEPDASAPAVLPESTVHSSESVTTNAAPDVDPATTGSVPPVSSDGIDAASIAGPIPLPRPRRQASVAIAGPVPLPRPRPVAAETSASASPSIDDRHRAE
jgi:cytoskeletal protein RodZ